jgi:hypothetical protein
MVLIVYMAGGIALAGNIAQIITVHTVSSSLTGLLIYILGNVFLIREVVS